MEKSNNTAHVITAQRKGSGEGVQFHSRVSALETHFALSELVELANAIPATRSCSLTSISLPTGTLHFLKNIFFYTKCWLPGRFPALSSSTPWAHKSGGRNMPKQWQAWDNPESRLACEDANACVDHSKRPLQCAPDTSRAPQHSL